MTKEEAVQKLTALQDEANASVDRERAHVEADRILLEIINDKDIEDAFTKITKWYA